MSDTGSEGERWTLSRVDQGPMVVDGSPIPVGEDREVVPIQRLQAAERERDEAALRLETLRKIRYRGDDSEADDGDPESWRLRLDYHRDS